MIIVGISKPKKFRLASELIKLHQGTESSHVYIKFYSQKYDLWLIYEAAYGEVSFIEESRWLQRNVSIAEKKIECSQEQLDSIVKWCIFKCQVPYGFLTVLGIALGAKSLVEDGANSFICTELSYNILQMVGVDILDLKYSLKAFENFIRS
jgi:hypothetical protein